MVNFETHGQTDYQEFRSERFVTKRKKKKKEKSKIIKKNYLPNFQGKPYKVTKSERQYFTSDLHLLKNQLGQAQRLFDIAQSRDILTKDISVKS